MQLRNMLLREIILLISVQPAIIIMTSELSQCSRDRVGCPPGHQLTRCIFRGQVGLYCDRCSKSTFQPNPNKIGDKCRFRKSCDRWKMQYSDKGSITRDAHCVCAPGYHFENEDQRACVPNQVCEIGYGQGLYGLCEKCDGKTSFSNRKDTVQRCVKFTDCNRLKRCLSKPGDDTKDNLCGSTMVHDLKECERALNTGLVVGCVLAGVLVIITLTVSIIIYRHRKIHTRSWSNAKRLDDEIRHLIDISKNNPKIASKVLERSCCIISQKIDGKRWDLAKELFDKMRLEDLIAEHKGMTAEESAKSFLSEYRRLQGDNSDSISQLLQSIRKCDRDDIVIAICQDHRNRPAPDSTYIAMLNQKRNSSKYSLCPCSRTPSKTSGQQDNQPLTVNPIYPEIQPSAPITEDSFPHGSNSNLTYPIQASS